MSRFMIFQLPLVSELFSAFLAEYLYLCFGSSFFCLSSKETRVLRLLFHWQQCPLIVVSVIVFLTFGHRLQTTTKLHLPEGNFKENKMN